MQRPETAPEDALDALRQRAKREINEGLLPAAQFAVAQSGQLVAFESLGDCSDDTLFPIFSCTKAITSSLAWMALAEGKFKLDDLVSVYISEFGSNGKDGVTMLHLLTHTAGFPNAPYRPTDYWDPEKRAKRYEQWRLDWEPGTQFTYHPSSSMYVIADVLERVWEDDFVSLINQRIAKPLNLPELLVGCPSHLQDRVADIVHCGAAVTAKEYAALGLEMPPITEVTEDALTKFNEPETRSVPIPGGGGYTSAKTLALWYQALIGYGPEPRWQGLPWNEETVQRAREIRTHGLRDPIQGYPVLRGLGIVIAGKEDAHLRGFGHGVSEGAFGHNGAGGQIAWVDPETELSFVYLTNGHDRHTIRQARRGIALSSLAANLA